MLNGVEKKLRSVGQLEKEWIHVHLELSKELFKLIRCGNSSTVNGLRTSYDVQS